MSSTNSIYDDMSVTERTVADFLSFKKLWWDYEYAVYVQDDKGRPRVWTPDFYLPDVGIYIEVVGNSKLSDYDWRKRIYSLNHIPIIFVYPNQDKYWQQKLVDELINIHQSRWELLKKLKY